MYNDKFTKEEMEQIVQFKETEMYGLLKQVFDKWYEDAKVSSFNAASVDISPTMLAWNEGYRKGKKALMDELLGLPDDCKRILTERKKPVNN